MKYAGYFRNIKNEPISVTIVTGSSTFTTPYNYNSSDDKVYGSVSSSNELTFAGDNPVTISLNGGNTIFEPIKPLSCTISVITADYIPEIYSEITHFTKVRVDNLKTGDILFQGYVTPNIYSQPYADVYDKLEIECISALSALEYYPYPTAYKSASIQSLETVVTNVLGCSGLYGFGDIVANRSLGYEYMFGKGYQLYEQNFYEDDEEHKPWSCKDVLTEIAKYFCVSFVEYQDKIHVVYYIDGMKDNYSSYIDLMEYTFGGDDTTLSLGETYQKVTVVDNQYPINDGVNLEEMIGNAKVIEFADNESPVNGVDYIQPPTHGDGDPRVMTKIFENTFCLNLKAWNKKDDDRKKNISFLSLYTNPETCHSYYYPNSGWCMANEAQEMPEKINYKDLQTATTGILCKTYNKEVDSWFGLVQNVAMSPSLLLTCHSLGSGNGMSELAFNSYQPLWKFTDKVKKVTTGKKKYIYINFSANWNYQEKNTGKSTGGGSVDDSHILDTPPRLCTSIKIIKADGSETYYLGDAYNSLSHFDLTSTSGKWNGYTFRTNGGDARPNWGGDSHTNPDNAYVKVNNDGHLYSDWYKESQTPMDRYLAGSKTYICSRLFFYPDWQTGAQYVNGDIGLLTNIDWTMGLKNKSNGIAIPIKGFELEQGDTFEITFYKPAVIGDGLVLDCVLLSNLEIDILEEGEDKIDNGDERSDVIYTNTDNDYNENGTFIGNYETELLINTQQPDFPQSYSSVLQNGLFVNKMTDPFILNPEFVQEENIVTKYVQHFSKPKLILESTQNHQLSPETKCIYHGHVYYIDSYELDVAMAANKLKLIEF